MISREYPRPGCQCHSVAGCLKLNLPSQGACVWDGTGRGVDDQCSTAGLIMTMYNWTDDKNANNTHRPHGIVPVLLLFDVLLRGDVSIEVFMHFWVVACWLVSVPCPQDYAPLDG